MKKSKILLVEGDTDLALKLKSTIRYFGYEITSIVDTEEKAIKVMASEKPDIILMNISNHSKKKISNTIDIIQTRLNIPVVSTTQYIDNNINEQNNLTEPIRELLNSAKENDLKNTIEKALVVAKFEREQHHLKSKLLKTEKALQDIENRYQTISELTSELAYSLKIEPGNKITIEWVTGAFTSVTGYTHEELQSLGGWDILTHPEDKNILLDQLKALFANRAKTIEYRIITKGGQIRWIRDFAQSTFSIAKNRVTYIKGAIKDISKQKIAEAKIVDLNKRLVMILDSIPADIYVSNLETNEILYMNAQMKNSFGENLTGKTCWQVFRKTTEPCAHCTNSKLLDKNNQAGDIIIWEGQNPVSQKYYLNHDKAILWDNGQFVRMQISIDINERKKAEEALRASEEKIRSIFRVAPTGIGLVKNRVLFDVNPRICDMSGYSKEELIGNHSEMLYPSQEESDRVGREKYQQIAKYGTGVVETQWRRKDGSIIDILLASTPIDTSDLSKGVTFTALDISERKQADKALVKERDFIAAILRWIDSIVIVTDLNGKLISFNHAAEKCSGYHKEELQNEPFWDILVPQFEREAVKKTIKNFKEKQLTSEGQNYWVSKNGQKHLIHWYNSILDSNNDNSKFVLCTGLDITKSKKAENQLKAAHNELELRVKERTDALNQSLETLKQTQKELIRSERLAALGNMVAGVAHEISTPIGIGVTEASFLSDQTDELQKLFNSDDLTRQHFQEYIQKTQDSTDAILKNLSRSADLIKTFKQVAVDQITTDQRIFNLTDYFNGILLSLKSEIKRSRHKVLVDCPVDLSINSYPGAFAQIITNLIMNSLIHGFEGINKGEINLKVAMKNHHLLIQYNDNGIGMDEKTLKQVFDPFFTTKRNRGGTGLGMQIVYNLVTQKLKGTISCHSTSGNGTEFSINIPLVS